MKAIYFLRQKVGFINGNREFIAHRSYVHVFHLLEGFGFSIGLLHQLKREGVKVIKVLYRHDGQVEKLETKIDYLFSNGFEHTNNFDHQLILPIKEFNQISLEEFESVS